MKQRVYQNSSPPQPTRQIDFPPFSVSWIVRQKILLDSLFSKDLIMKESQEMLNDTLNLMIISFIFCYRAIQSENRKIAAVIFLKSFLFCNLKIGMQSYTRSLMAPKAITLWGKLLFPACATAAFNKDKSFWFQVPYASFIIDQIKCHFY